DRSTLTGNVPGNVQARRNSQRRILVVDPLGDLPILERQKTVRPVKIRLPVCAQQICSLTTDVGAGIKDGGQTSLLGIVRKEGEANTEFYCHIRPHLPAILRVTLDVD